MRTLTPLWWNGTVRSEGCEIFRPKKSVSCSGVTESETSLFLLPCLSVPPILGDTLLLFVFILLSATGASGNNFLDVLFGRTRSGECFFWATFQWSDSAKFPPVVPKGMRGRAQNPHVSSEWTKGQKERELPPQMEENTLPEATCKSWFTRWNPFIQHLLGRFVL